jgi:hypothetical protein
MEAIHRVRFLWDGLRQWRAIEGRDFNGFVPPPLTDFTRLLWRDVAAIALTATESCVRGA